jgi:hypothetical protein
MSQARLIKEATFLPVNQLVSLVCSVVLMHHKWGECPVAVK